MVVHWSHNRENLDLKFRQGELPAVCELSTMTLGQNEPHYEVEH